MTMTSPSFSSNWVMYSSLKGAHKGGAFRGQKGFQVTLNRLMTRMASGRGSFGRQLRLLQTLRRKKQTTDSLCRQLKVSRRTLFRDLATIRSAGIDIVSDGQYFSLNPKQLKSTLGKAL